MSKIELRRIDESNFIDCFNLKLKKEQERFVSHPIRSLAQAYVYYKQCTPFGVVADGEMVGYGMVIYDYDEEEYDLWHVMIDAEQQGKGYGKAAVGLFLDYIRQKPFGDSGEADLPQGKSSGAASVRKLRLCAHRRGGRGRRDRDDPAGVGCIFPVLVVSPLDKQKLWGTIGITSGQAGRE